MPHLSKVPRMVFVHHNSVVVLATSISTTSRMLPVLANTAMTSADVTTLLPVFPETCMAESAVSAAPCGLSYLRAAVMLLAIAKAGPELIAKEALHPNKCLHHQTARVAQHTLHRSGCNDGRGRGLTSRHCGSWSRALPWLGEQEGGGLGFLVAALGRP
jgi:hypothetical protein